jgi:deoxycytidylate deaminase
MALLDYFDLARFQTQVLGCVHATNDIIIAVAGQNQTTQHATACLYVETEKRKTFNLNCLQATAEAVICAYHSKNPILQV